MHALSKIKYLSLSFIVAAGLTSGCGSDDNKGPGTGGSKLDGAAGTGGTVTEAGVGGAIGTGGVGIDAGNTGIAGTGGATILDAGSTGGTTALDAGSTGGVAIDGPKGTGGATTGTGGRGGSTGTGGRGGSGGSGGSTGTGGVKLDGGVTLDGSPDVNTTGDDAAEADASQGGVDLGGVISGDTVICSPRTAVINDFSSSDCYYGDYGSGEMVTGAYVTDPVGTSTVKGTCGGAAGWAFSGTLGVATDSSANDVGFALNLMGSVQQSGLDGSLDCNAYDLSAYSGFAITLSSPSGAVSTIELSVEVSGVRQPPATVNVPQTPTAVNVTWAQLGINQTAAARITAIAGRLVNGTAPIAVDLAIKRFALY